MVQGSSLTRLLHGPATIADLLQLRLPELPAVVVEAERLDDGAQPGFALLPPIDRGTEVWAAGVTYQRSEQARVEESATPDIYTRVYRAERPELFFTATARRVAGSGWPIAVRADSTWDVPEPDLALVLNAHAELVGYTIADDVSSRSSGASRS